jgi:hypothetical protein
MRMAKVFGLEVPFHGMLYGKDGSLSYFIKRTVTVKEASLQQKILLN